MIILLNKNKYIIIGLFFLLLHPFNLYILNNINNIEKILLIFSLIFLVLSIKKIKKKSFRFIIPWFIFVVFLFFDSLHGIDYSFLIYHLISLLFVFSLINGDDDNSFEKFVLIILIFSFIHALFTLLIYIFPSIYNYIRPLVFAQSIMYEGYKTALTGHYSTNAIYITIGLISSFFLIFKNQKISVKYILLILLFLITLLLTTKRAVLVFSIMAIIITSLFMLYNKKYKKRFFRIGFILISLIFISWIFFGNSLFSNFLNRFVNDGDSGREYLYSRAIDMFYQKPLLGNKTGYFRQNYQPLNNDSLAVNLNVHNIYFQLLCENGVIGLLLFLFPMFITLFNSIKYLRLKIQEKNDLNGKIYLISMSICYQLYFIFYSFTGNTIYDNMVFIPYYIFCSYIYYLILNFNKEES